MPGRELNLESMGMALSRLGVLAGWKHGECHNAILGFATQPNIPAVKAAILIDAAWEEFRAQSQIPAEDGQLKQFVIFAGSPGEEGGGWDNILKDIGSGVILSFDTLQQARLLESSLTAYDWSHVVDLQTGEKHEQ